MISMRRAAESDRRALIALLEASETGYVDPPQAWILALEDDRIAGCARLEECDGVLMLRPLVVAAAYRRQGVGKIILKSVMPADRPTMLVARGEAIGFYESVGFSQTQWNRVPLSQTAECEACPDRTECMPQPMIYDPGKGVEKDVPH